KSFGKGIGQVTLPLTDGFAVKATVLLVSGPNDNSIHREGITPDVIYDGEDIIQAAAALIQSPNRP
ncbi:MAG: carboxy- processing protease, partial [Clostridiales bacterium]|nr:carboxy- processing protease [Clostridiales bacterium]